jgi:tartronate-semialdehyde synthase
MDYQVRLAFDNIENPDLEGYGVDHVAVTEGPGCKAIRMTSPNEFPSALYEAKQMMAEHRVPVVVECILERVTTTGPR